MSAILYTLVPLYGMRILFCIDKDGRKDTFSEPSHLLWLYSQWDKEITFWGDVPHGGMQRHNLLDTSYCRLPESRTEEHLP
jgi:hypothetical protein